MGGFIVRIEKLDNGFEVEICDQKARAKNKKPGAGLTYTNPWRSYAFRTTAEVCKFLEKNLDKAVPTDDFSSSFDAAVAADEDDD
jgi:hypothetical protein